MNDWISSGNYMNGCFQIFKFAVGLINLLQDFGYLQKGKNRINEKFRTENWWQVSGNHFESEFVTKLDFVNYVKH